MPRLMSRSMSRATRVSCFLAFAVALLAAPVAAQEVVQSQGVDSRVDYESLKDFGPWDDRNYQLTQNDLDLLADDEAELRDPIPAFYRVQVRRENPAIQNDGARYPRSAFNAFKNEYGGLLYQGVIYRGLRRDEDGRLELVLENGIREDELGEHLRALEGEVRVTSPVGAAESAIKIHPTDTDIVVAGSNGPGSGQKMHYSTDGGESWTETTLPLGNTCCDPTIDYSSDGSKVYAATLGFTTPCCGIWVYRSADGGQTWTDLATEPGNDARRELGSNGSDKEFIHVDKYATSPFKDTVYLSWHTGNVMQFASSTDQAHTWNIINTGEGSGIGSDIVTDKTGKVYHFWPNFSAADIRLQRSTNGGASFGFDKHGRLDQRRLRLRRPGHGLAAGVHLRLGRRRSERRSLRRQRLRGVDRHPRPESGIPANNHARIQVAYSRDGGDTWNVSTPHPTVDQMSVDRFHQWAGGRPRRHRPHRLLRHRLRRRPRDRRPVLRLLHGRRANVGPRPRARRASRHRASTPASSGATTTASTRCSTG